MAGERNKRSVAFRFDGELVERLKRRAAEAGARRLAARMATCLAGALLVQHAPTAVADAFCASRLGADWAGVLGTLPRSTDTSTIVARALPAAAA